MRRAIWIAVGLLLSVGLAACRPAATSEKSGTSVAVAGGSFTQISPETLAEMLAAKDFIFVNTHIPYEGEIEQTDAFIPYDETLQRLNEYPTDKGAQIVLYCRSGRMSAIAAEALVGAGYTDVWDLAGGFVAWEDAGFELLHQ